MANDQGHPVETLGSQSRQAPSPQPARAIPWYWIALPSVLALLAIWAYWPAIKDVLTAWTANQDYTHGFFVVPISLWLLWVRRGLAPKSPPAPDWRGIFLLIAAGLVRFVAGRFYLPQLDAWSIPLWIGGTVWLLCGWQIFRWALPSIAFLWFATPLPGTIEIMLSTPLQMLAASLSAFVLRVIGQPALAEGTTVLLDDQILDVEKACSGLRMFYGIFALAVACVALARPARWKAVLVLLTAAPVAIIANVVRITVTGLLLKYASGEAAQKFSHDIAGYVMIPLAVALFMLFLTILGRIVRNLRETGGAVWLIKWAFAIFVVFAALFLWGKRQQARAITTILDTASRYESEKDWPKAIQFLTRYIHTRPDDHDALTHLADLYRKHAKSPADQLRAIELLKTAWKNQPEKEDLAISAIELALSHQDYDEAIELCDEVLSAPRQPETKAKVTKLRAESLFSYLQSDKNRGDYSWDNVQQAFEASLKLPNYDVSHAAILADVLRQRITSIEAA
jgi:exosortase